MAKRVTSKVTLNKIAIQNLTKAATRALAKTVDVLQDEIRNAEVIPMDTGALSGEQFFVDDSQVSKGYVSLVHSTPYARRLYFHPEYDFQKYEHAFAMGKWFDPWISGIDKDRGQEIYNKMYKRESGI